MDSYFIGINIGIRMESRESSGNHKYVHFGIQRSGSLLKTITRFLKETNKGRFILDNQEVFLCRFILPNIHARRQI
jgi:hypothetical protein